MNPEIKYQELLEKYRQMRQKQQVQAEVIRAERERCKNLETRLEESEKLTSELISQMANKDKHIKVQQKQLNESQIRVRDAINWSEKMKNQLAVINQNNEIREHKLKTQIMHAKCAPNIPGRGKKYHQQQASQLPMSERPLNDNMQKAVELIFKGQDTQQKVASKVITK